MIIWALRGGMTLGLVMAIIITVLDMVGKGIPAIAAPISYGVTFGALLGSVHGLRTLPSSAPLSQVARVLFFDVLFGAGLGTFIGSLFSVLTSLQFSNSYRTIGLDIIPVSLVFTVVGAIIGLVIGLLSRRRQSSAPSSDEPPMMGTLI